MKKNIPFIWIALIGVLAACAPEATQSVKTAPTPSVDQRIVVTLNDLQRDHVLAQMRTMLDSTQQIVEGLASGNMAQVEEAALVAGFKVSQTPEHKAEMGGLQMNKALPQEFRQMSRVTRMMFDDVAGMAASGADAQDIQAFFADGMYGCNACHGTFQIPKP